MGDGRSIGFIQAFQDFLHVSVLPEPTIDQLNQPSEPRFVRSDSKSSSNSGPPTPKDRIRGEPRVRKRVPKKTGLSTTPPKNLPLSMGQDEPSIQASSQSDLLTPSPTPTFHSIRPSSQPASPLAVSTQPMTPSGPRDFIHYQSNQGFDNTGRSEASYSRSYPLAPPNFQSRIEDVTMAPVGLSPNSPKQCQSHIRSQYIMATQKLIWREMR
jgi:hypothetical protein